MQRLFFCVNKFSKKLFSILTVIHFRVTGQYGKLYIMQNGWCTKTITEKFYKIFSLYIKYLKESDHDDDDDGKQKNKCCRKLL